MPSHQSTSGAALHGLTQDTRHTVRALLRSPAFTLVAILTLTLGIGVTTAIVSIVDHVLLHSLPFRDAGRLVMMLERGDDGGFRAPSAPTAADWKQDPAASRAFEGLTFVRGDGATLTHGDAIEPIGVAYVEPDFFDVLGAHPVLGRPLVAEDHRRDAPNVALIPRSRCGASREAHRHAVLARRNLRPSRRRRIPARAVLASAPTGIPRLTLG